MQQRCRVWPGEDNQHHGYKLIGISEELEVLVKFFAQEYRTRYPAPNRVAPNKAPTLAPVASTILPNGIPHRYIPRLAEVDYSKLRPLLGSMDAKLTSRLLCVEDRFSLSANSGPHAE